MKDTVSFVFVGVSLFYYICKYKIAYFDRQVSLIEATEAFLLLYAVLLFSTVALYSTASKTALASLTVVLMGLLFDSIANKYPGKGLIASSTTVIYLLVESSQESQPIVITVCSLYTCIYVALMFLQYRRNRSYRLLRPDSQSSNIKLGDFI